ncbi:MAG: 16S rRNA (cytosine(967)-C(5))-methyltransferase RsmB [Vulcanimicrobiaceae bacterium]
MSARSLALAVARDVFAAEVAQRRTAQESFNYHLRKTKIDARDRGFATELAYGTIKMRRLIDWYLQPYVGNRDKPLPPVIAEVLRLAMYELLFMRSSEHGVVNEYVGLAKTYGHRGTAGLVNAVLRSYLRDKPEPPQESAFADHDDYLGTKHSFPTWIVKQWRARFGDEHLEAMLEGVNAPAQTAISVNTVRTTIEDVEKTFADQGIPTRRSDYVEDTLLLESGAYAQAHESDAAGAWVMHSESAAMPVDVMNPQAGEAILDLCSGRGNKALQEGARLHGEGSLTCIEKDTRKATVLQQRLEEGGIAAAVVVGDATQPVVEQQFERVILDAPCSGIGTLGRHPEARWRKRAEDGARLADLQRALLAQAATHLHAGGVLVYAVCSTDPRESDDVVNEFLERNNFSRGLMPGRYEELQNAFGDVVIAPGLDGRDGFYIARLERGA